MKTIKYFKKLICVFFLLNTLSYSLSKPISTINEHFVELKEEPAKPNRYVALKDNMRLQRQIVQPKWLLQWGDSNLFLDEKVHVTDQNLNEVAEIRENIQNAVNSDSYATDNVDNIQNEKVTPTTVPSSLYDPSSFQIEPLQPIPSAISPPQVDFTELMGNMERTWLEFWNSFTQLFQFA